MKQGQRVKWVDGMGFEAHGTVDWDCFELEEKGKVPVRSGITGGIVLIEHNKLEKV